MSETKQRFNEYMTKRELKRRFLINDKFIGRFFPTPVKISTAKNSDKLRDAWPVSVVEEIMQRKKFQHDHYSTRGSEPNAKKRKTVRNFLARPLLRRIFEHGQCVYRTPAVGKIRSYCAEQVDTLWEEVLRFENPHQYYVDLSQKLWDLKHDLISAHRAGEQR